MKIRHELISVTGPHEGPEVRTPARDGKDLQFVAANQVEQLCLDRVLVTDP